MTTFFAQELKKIADRCEFVGDARYVGKACVFRLSEDVTGKMEFATEGVAQEYSALKITLFNRKEGVIDTQKTTLGDIIGRKNIYGNKKSPYIWSVDSPDWYGYKPTNADYDAMAQTADDYLEMFAEPQMSEDIGMSM
mgnify:CR=1 FL=1